MTKRIFRYIISVAFAVLLAAVVLIMGVLYGYFDDVQGNRLKSQWQFVAAAVEESGEDYLKKVDSNDCRITLIDSDGTVLYDSKADAAKMENHLDRAEIDEAIKAGSAKSERISKTLTKSTIYYAEKLSDGRILRLSIDRVTVSLLIVGIIQPLAAVIIIMIALSAFLANKASKKIVVPLNSLDLEHPLENDTYDEISPLLSHIEKQQKKIAGQRLELENRKTEFYAVIKNMKEGLLLIGKDNTVISINPAAEAFFGSEDSKGKDFYEVERDLKITSQLEKALTQGKSSSEYERNGRIYRLNVSRVDENNGNCGAVMLIIDVTDKVFAERRRREFSANVSHELKTPLHSIMANAELIENGIAKTEDIPKFAGKINGEAKRLLNLISDIIRLSQLDEDDDMKAEETDLYETALGCIEAVSDAAKQKGVVISVSGGPVSVLAVKSLLSETIYNLLDNAVKYNIESGKVDVTVENGPNCGIITVSDTGIGIPPEDTDRVFERFYRVDKSRSKETGGTGLGLSIVKHSVSYMGGKISLKSVLGEGTSVIVKIPYKKLDK